MFFFFFFFFFFFISKVKKYLDIISSNKMILFGSSTGAAAALYSAYFKRDIILGIISRGGRPDLVPLYIIKNFPCYKKKNEKDSIIPVLFIVGSKDKYITPLNENIFLQLGKKIESREEENDTDYCKDYEIDFKKSIHNKRNKTSINNDNEFIKLNSNYKKQWKWIENASHLFEEAGKTYMLNLSFVKKKKKKKLFFMKYNVTFI